MTQTRPCTNCNKVKDLSDFHNDRTGKYGKACVCKECKKIYYTSPSVKVRNKDRMRKAYHTHTPEQRKRVHLRNTAWRKETARERKNYQLKYEYGITIEFYEKMLADQKGICALGHGHIGMHLAVDHCHDTGKVRGLLCYDCNRVMALLDNPVRHEKALEYKKRSQ